ncbi:MAG: UDP-glucose 4-epimerase GalE [Candidatus Saccharibacteria bacterium]|nr:UDP-glucose 4-epimerase GalE [Candidatus Saccharibacteria bacterium]
MKILLTGGTGYIGSHAAVELIKLGYEIEILDNLFNSKITVLDKIEKITGVRPVFHRVDLLDVFSMEKVFRDGNFDLVIHFAGLKAVGESVEKPLKYYENNVCGTINLLKCMKKYGVNKIIFSSSATVYGDQGVSELTEEMTAGVGITNPYGETKYMIEEILKDVAEADQNFEVTILRYFNPVGAHESGLLGEDPNDIPNNLMPVIMKVSTGEIPELLVYGDDYNTVDGTGVRDYIHVVDLVKGHIAAIDKMKSGASIYNLGSGRGTSVLEMVAAFEAESGKTLPYKIVGRRAGDLGEVYANPSKAERELNWKTELTIKDAMRDTINYLRNCGKNE